MYWICVVWVLCFIPVVACYGTQAKKERLNEQAWTCELMYVAPSFDYERPKLQCWYEVGSNGKLSEYAICTCNEYKYKKLPGGKPYETEVQ